MPSSVEVNEIAEIQVERIEIVLNDTRIEAENGWGNVRMEVDSLGVTLKCSLLISSDVLDRKVAIAGGTVARSIRYWANTVGLITRIFEACQVY